MTKQERTQFMHWEGTCTRTVDGVTEDTPYRCDFKEPVSFTRATREAKKFCQSARHVPRISYARVHDLHGVE